MTVLKISKKQWYIIMNVLMLIFRGSWEHKHAILFFALFIFKAMMKLKYIVLSLMRLIFRSARKHIYICHAVFCVAHLQELVETCMYRYGF